MILNMKNDILRGATVTMYNTSPIKENEWALEIELKWA